MSETGPGEGTLKVFPSVKLSNAYLMLRPFFTPTVPTDSPEIYDAKNWKFGGWHSRRFFLLIFQAEPFVASDLSNPEFPGIRPLDGGYIGPQLTHELHPHLRIERTMTSIPKVYPGDAVFWHCDVIHSVEETHAGSNDSAGKPFKSCYCLLF